MPLFYVLQKQKSEFAYSFLGISRIEHLRSQSSVSNPLRPSKESVTLANRTSEAESLRKNFAEAVT